MSVRLVALGLAATIVVSVAGLCSSYSATATSTSCDGAHTPASWSALKNAVASTAGTSQSPVVVCLGQLGDLTNNTVVGDRLTLANTGHVVFDLNGHSLSITGPTYQSAFRVPVGSFLTMRDSSPSASNRLSLFGGSFDGSDWQKGGAAGLGGDGGQGYTMSGESSGSITIASGRIHAEGGDGPNDSLRAGGAGIGGGGSGSNISSTVSGGSSTFITITGGEITAIGGDAVNGGGGGAGIGGGGASPGSTSGSGGVIDISGGKTVATRGSSNASTIGQGGTATAAFPGNPAIITVTGNYNIGNDSSGEWVRYWYYFTAQQQINSTVSSLNSSPVNYGTVITAPANPTPPAGYQFSGWRDNSVAGPLHDFSTEVVSDVYIYASWTAIPTPSGSPSIPTTTALAQSGVRWLPEYIAAILALTSGIGVMLWRRKGKLD